MLPRPALPALLLATLALTACAPGDTAPARGSAAGAASVVAPGPWREVGERVAAFVEREMAAKDIPAMSVALVDGDEVVWARGFGYEDLTDSVAADAATVHRVGSVSKLFTDIAVMQLVEAGRVDLDAPASTYVPDVRPRNPYDREPTLRQLMTHRSGFVREPPVGNYFDHTAPSLAATVRSLNETALVYEPEARVKYSNAAVATVGYALETLSGRPFAEALETAVLDPLGMDDSAFEPRPGIVDRLADAV
ncbi:MAG: beta-lactamase family protein, partial [Gemmatimonadetes bacterium]|nr:beta-lactamase family protein [Gemmatimonadota bacterium]